MAATKRTIEEYQRQLTATVELCLQHRHRESVIKRLRDDPYNLPAPTARWYYRRAQDVLDRVAMRSAPATLAKVAAKVGRIAEDAATRGQDAIALRAWDQYAALIEKQGSSDANPDDVVAGLVAYLKENAGSISRDAIADVIDVARKVRKSGIARHRYRAAEAEIVASLAGDEIAEPDGVKDDAAPAPPDTVPDDEVE